MTKTAPLGNRPYEPKPSGKTVMPEITLGEEICDRLRRIYHPSAEKAQSYKAIAKLYSEIRRVAKIYYPELTDVERLKQIRGWSDNDIQEALDFSKF